LHRERQNAEGATIQNLTSSPSEWSENYNYGREFVIYKKFKVNLIFQFVKRFFILARNEEEVQLIEELSKINQSNNYESHHH
jgi:hypothetical protein